jgi:hypothetical protein
MENQTFYTQTTAFRTFILGFNDRYTSKVALQLDYTRKKNHYKEKKLTEGAIGYDKGSCQRLV